MDTIDKKILNIIQKDFPVIEEPFKAVADEVGLSEDEVLKRINNLKEEGIIRRIGAVFDSKKMGYASTLCAAKVPKENLKKFVAVVNSYAGVTHNYRRSHEYNVWFTFIASDEETLKKSLGEIRDKTGVTEIISMRNVPELNLCPVVKSKIFITGIQKVAASILSVSSVTSRVTYKLDRLYDTTPDSLFASNRI